MISVLLLCSFVLFIATACGDKTEEGGGSSAPKGGTLEEVGMLYGKKDYKPMQKIRTLDDIYFPAGFLETGLGMWIYKSSTDKWVRTNTDEGRALFDTSKPTFISSHGMGWNSYADMPELYADEYNVLAFVWGTLADEKGYASIVDKVWLTGFSWKLNDRQGVGARWQHRDAEGNEIWETEDVCDACAIEIYCAYYYDLFSRFPEYNGSSIHLFGHSYGGMLSIGATSLLISAYRCGLIGSYMLPDIVSMLDPYMMRLQSNRTISWLGDYTPDFGNICEVMYQTALDCHKLGITVRMTRFNKGVAVPATLYVLHESHDGDVPTSYWNFVNNVVYSHLEDDTILGGAEGSHNYAWDWFTSYYTGTMLYDQAATKTQEQALCFEMDYDVSFARTGIKYNIDLNGTKYNTDDDVMSSFYREYKFDGDDTTYPNSDGLDNETAEQRAELTGNAKIAGFVYLDANKNGKLDERIKDHLSGAKVTVKDGSGKAIYTTTTTINGYYEVEVTEEGTYTVSVTLPKNYSLSTEGASLEAAVNIIDAKHQLAINNFGATK